MASKTTSKSNRRTVAGAYEENEALRAEMEELREKLEEKEEEKSNPSNPSNSTSPPPAQTSGSSGISWPAAAAVIVLVCAGALVFWAMSDRQSVQTADPSSQEEIVKLRKELEDVKAKREDPPYTPLVPPTGYASVPPPHYDGVPHPGFSGPQHHYGPPKRVHREIIPVCSQGGVYDPAVRKCLRQNYVRTR